MKPYKAKTLAELAESVKDIIDPVYTKLKELSAKLDSTGIGWMEIPTPTGKFLWQKNLPPEMRHEENKTVN